MKNKISRRQFLQVAGASAAALLLASCSGNSASSVSSSSVASSAASSVAASSAAASSEATSTVTTTGKTLVVYFSATGTTQGVAQTIADTVGADLFEVVPSDPYTSDDLNWTNNDSRVSREHNDEGLRAVALESTDVDGWDDYDTVFIGYPIWWGIAAWPMSSFVAVNDFTGKTVIPFCTSTSSGIGQSGKLCFRGRECRVQCFQRFAPGAGLGGFQLGGASGLGQFSGNLLPLALCLLCRAQRGL